MRSSSGGVVAVGDQVRVEGSEGFEAVGDQRQIGLLSLGAIERVGELTRLELVILEAPGAVLIDFALNYLAEDLCDRGGAPRARESRPRRHPGRRPRAILVGAAGTRGGLVGAGGLAGVGCWR